jgi:hypothetical protein
MVMHYQVKLAYLSLFVSKKEGVDSHEKNYDHRIYYLGSCGNSYSVDHAT